MSSFIKTVARIALPIAGSFFGPWGAALGGAIGGAIGGGGLKGALLGGISGYASAGLGSSILGAPAGSTLAKVTGDAALQGPTLGSGLLGLATGGGVRALTAPLTQAAGGGIAQSLFTDPTKLLLAAGNGVMAMGGADAAKDAAKIQAASINKGIAENKEAQAPYTELGRAATDKIQAIQADPAGYISNSPFYKTLAADATNRLLANQAAKGKVASGGTADALQERLLQLGHGLVQQDIATLQTQANTGANAAGSVGTTTANMRSQQGDVQAAGKVGAFNAMNNGYQNMINTILALQGLNKTPTYAPSISV